jgi:hypothetical protein
MEDVVTFLGNNPIGSYTLMILVALAVHRRYLVLGRELDREKESRLDEKAAKEKVELALQAANERELKVNEANAKMATLVPELLKLVAKPPEGNPNEVAPK